MKYAFGDHGVASGIVVPDVIDVFREADILVKEIFYIDYQYIALQSMKFTQTNHTV